jgi:RNA polymerase sigma-70 factor (ECF subfamily)
LRDGGTLSDAALVRRALAGEPEMYGVLVERYRQEFGRYAAAMLGGDADAAADALQEAFIRAFDSLASCRDPGKFKAWVFRIVSNQCHNARKRLRRYVALGDYDAPGKASADGDVVSDELAQAIEAALEMLTPEQREAFVMKHVEGRSYTEMAELLAVGEDALKMRVHRARDELRKHLQELA